MTNTLDKYTRNRSELPSSVGKSFADLLEPLG